MDDTNFKRPFPSHLYRSIRKGLIALPEMERRLMIDLRRLAGMVRGEALSGLEWLYAVESIETVREVLVETLAAYRGLREFLSPHVLDDVDHFERILYQHVPEAAPEMIDELVALMRRYGGVRGMLDQAIGSLAARDEVLMTTLRRVHEGKRESLVSALAGLEEGYLRAKTVFPKWAGPLQSLEELAQQWAKLLKDAQDAIAKAQSYWEREEAEDNYFALLEKLCYEYPAVAERLGLRTPCDDAPVVMGDLPCDRLYRNEVICMLICGPVFCLVVIIIMVACSRDCQG
jgi:hypothetical protein